MALSGELSDLSLAELIEFFCNQRKTGRLKVIYPRGPGYFFLHAGSVVHAEVGTLRGIEAVYYALTLPNASFKFSATSEPAERTINQPWTSVVLEGLRRMDEGIQPADPFPANHAAPVVDAEPVEDESDVIEEEIVAAVPDKTPARAAVIDTGVTPFLWESQPAWLRTPWGLGAVVGSVALALAAIGIPWGWYAHSQSAKAMNQPKAATETAAQTTDSTSDVMTTAAEPTASTAQKEAASNSEADALAAKRLKEARVKEKEKARAQETAALTAPSTSARSSAANSGAKKVTVQVSYDENGRVTQASGGDPTALRIARQKRFPPGKAGSATITIPIN
jgi:hypothetical protein